MPLNRDLSEQEIFIAPLAMVAEIDAVQTRLACSRRYVSRSEVLRQLVRAGLDALATHNNSNPEGQLT